MDCKFSSTRTFHSFYVYCFNFNKYYQRLAHDCFNQSVDAFSMIIRLMGSFV